MTYLVAYRDYLEELAVTAHPDRAAATAAAEALPDAWAGLVVDAEGNLVEWTPKLVLDVFNALRPDRAAAVKRFESHAAARRRLFQRLGDAAKAERARAESAEATAPTRAKAKPTAKSTKSAIPADGRIRLLVGENPKRKTGAAHARFALYRDGMTVSAYLERGGTRSDLSWDRSHGFIAVEAAP